MHNDTLETLLSRHYDDQAPVPEALEQQLTASVQRKAKELQQQQLFATHIREQRVSRRRVIQLVALSSAGLGLLSAGVSAAHSLMDGQEHSGHYALNH
ncbi:MAG TPA: hypothetical protein VL461_01015 [Dictyobacter sp.]|jgi:hypothetical protein|nr:hypothetical protein [Dictyobacter sp.]